MTNEDLQTPPTELEISRAILLSGERVGDVIRKLAFQRDVLFETLNASTQQPVDSIRHSRPTNGLPPSGGSDAH